MARIDSLISKIEQYIEHGELHMAGDVLQALVEPFRSKRAKRIPPIRKEPRKRKTVVRLRGAEMAELREKVWKRDGCRCVDCDLLLSLIATPGSPNRMELSHIKSRGAGGADTMENTCSRCPECHAKSHNAGGKPCPPKPKGK